MHAHDVFGKHAPQVQLVIHLVHALAQREPPICLIPSPERHHPKRSHPRCHPLPQATNFGMIADTASCRSTDDPMLFTNAAPLGISGVKRTAQLSPLGLWR